MNRRSASILILFVLAMGAAFSSGCRRPAERTAERAVVDLLPGYVGPADSYRARVSTGSLGALMRGRVKQVVVDGANVRLAPGVRVADLHIEADEIEVDRSSRSLRSVGKARFRARIDGVDLAEMVRTRAASQVSPQVQVVGSQMKVRVVPEVLGRPTLPVDIEGGVAISDRGRFIHFVADSARLSVLPVPRSVIGFALDRVNPLVDLSKAPVPFTLETVLLRDGSLHIRGNIPPEEVVRRSQEAVAANREIRPTSQ